MANSDFVGYGDIVWRTDDYGNPRPMMLTEYGYVPAGEDQQQGDGGTTYRPIQNITYTDGSRAQVFVSPAEAMTQGFVSNVTDASQLAPSVARNPDIVRGLAPAPARAVAPPVPDRSAELAQFAGGILSRGAIGVPQVRAGGNYGPMYSMPNAASQPFSFINPGSGGGLLGNAAGNGSMGSAQPFGAPMGGGLLGGK